MKIFKKKWFWFLVILIGAVFTYYGFFKKDKNAVSFVTTKVIRGDISKQITANGTINPVNLIKVGTQVSGRIEKVYVDFNDKVKEGQLLAEIDKSVLQSQLDMAVAKKQKAKAALDLSKLELNRASDLFKKDYIAKAELDKAQVDYKTNLAEYNSADSEYKRADINLSYAIIKSPVNGIVISREIDEGQTVAASFSSPDLFKIAEDLSKMQIEASVSEADIGMIKHGQEVSFTVDAYEGEDFVGIIDNIRLNPVSESNVVTYTVIVKIDNEDLRLIPGMTAYLNIVIKKEENILKVNNSVFNFVPNSEKGNKNRNKNIMYKLVGKDLQQIEVKKGIVSDTETQIISDQVKEGDDIVEGYLDPSQKSKSNFGPGAGGGGGRR